MSLHDIAQQLAARGRNGDTVLVHMTPGEVGGLQALAMAQGGSLTLNPDTGLPEANFLKSLLPMLAGGALTVLSGGALSPLMAAGIVGGGTALATRNIGQGLIAGLGAFGGAGLGSAISGLGAATPAATAAALADGAATGPGSQAAMLAAQNEGFGQAGLQGLADATGRGMTAGSQGFMSGAQAAMRNPGQLVAGLGGAKGAATTLGMAALPALAATPETTVPTTTKQPDIPPYQFRYDTRMDPRAMQEPFDSSRERRWFGPVSGMAKGGPARVEDNPNFTMTGESADMFRYLMGQGSRPARATPAPAGAFDNIIPIGMRTFDFTGKPEGTGPNAMTPPAGATAGLPAALPAPGPGRGPMPSVIIDPVTGDPVLADRYVAPENRAPTGLAAIYAANPWMREMAGGAGPGSFGTDSSASYAQGGRLLQGSGDGVSDSIPGSIEGKQPVRVATGEFIFDARTVSEIGNGDTKAGAKKLYAVMDAVHKRRKQAQRGEPSGADRELRKLLA